MSARHSRVKSSTIVRIRNRRPSLNASDAKCPTLVGALGDGDRRPRAESPLAARAPAHLQPFLAVESAQLLVVHDQALPGQQDVQAAVAEPAALRGELPQPYPDRLIIGSAGSVADRRAVRPSHRTRPPLAHLERGT